MVKLNTNSAWWSPVLAGIAVLVVAALIVAVQFDVLPPLFGPEQAALHREVLWGCLLLGAVLIVFALSLVTLRAVDLLRTGRRLDEARLTIMQMERQADSEPLRRAREILSKAADGRGSPGAR